MNIIGKINYPSKIDDWTTFDKDNQTIALIILYTKEKEICPAYISKTDLNSKSQIVLLMIPNKKKEELHDLAVKKTIFFIKKNKIMVIVTA